MSGMIDSEPPTARLPLGSQKSFCISMIIKAVLLGIIYSSESSSYAILNGSNLTFG